MRTDLQPAFILHTRPYRETSLLIELFTQDHGRISLIAKGIRGRKSPLKALLQPFVPLLVSWQGKAELMTLTHAESGGQWITLKGECLLSGFYLNELLMKLLQKQDPHAKVFLKYQTTLMSLSHSFSEIHLRLFEKSLLEELGYGLSFDAITAENYYLYYPDLGFVLTDTQSSNSFKGEDILAFANESLLTTEALYQAKRITRAAIAYLLGGVALESRELFLKA